MTTMTFGENEIIYDSDQDLSMGLSSEKDIPSPEIPVQVQALANSVYAEFKRMMGIYGEDSIKELMPLIVTILESLDQSLTRYDENVVELEMLKGDADQLNLRYEKERQARKQAEQQLMENEDINEGLSREVRRKVEQCESDNRHLELRCKNYVDQIERLQERDAETKREYNVLRERHTEMIQSYMELIEKTKLQHLSQQAYQESPNSPSTRPKKEVLMRTASSPTHSLPSYPPGEGGDGDAPLNHYDSSVENSLAMESDFMPTVKEGRSLSLRDELPKSPTKATPVEFSENSIGSIPDSETPLESQEMDLTPGESIDGKIEKVEASAKEGLQSEAVAEINQQQQPPPDTPSSLADTTTSAPNENSLFAELSLQDIGDVDKGADIAGMSKEVENLLHENTKLLATKNALNVVKDDLIQQVDQLTTQQTLLKEELATSEKSRAELEQKLSEFEKDMSKLQEEMRNLKSNGAANMSAISDQNCSTPTKSNDDEDVLPMAQRKRFTRVEMARVLMERNQYKERLMELQEAVRWTETLRAARSLNESSDQPKAKQKSSIFHFFHRLFQSGNNDNNSSSTSSSSHHDKSLSPHGGASGGGHQYQPVVPSSRRLAFNERGGSGSLSMQYNAGSAKVMPRSKSTTHFYGRSPTIDSLRGGGGDDNESANLSELGKNKKDQKQTPVRLLDSNSRLQACGWSLPNTPSGPPREADTNRRTTVPVPVYCGPVFDNEPCMKLWCASAVNISDGGKVASLTTSSSGVAEDGCKSPSVKDSNGEDVGNVLHSPEVNRLHQELESQRKEIEVEARRRDNISSYVWMVASDTRSKNSTFGGSKVLVKDACSPSQDVEQFVVGSPDTHILCICSVPGVHTEDYTSLDNSAIDDADSVYNSADYNSSTQTNPPSLTDNEENPNSSADSPVTSATTEGGENKTTISSSDGETSQVEASSSSSRIGRLEKVTSPTQDVAAGKKEDEANNKRSKEGETPVSNTSPRISSMQPTMWLGAQNGHLYVHSAIASSSKCLHQIRLKDSVLGIVHSKGRVLAALADGTVAVFSRDTDGVWDLSCYYLLDLGKPHHSVRCMEVVYDRIWCGYRNRIHVVDPNTIKVETSFDAHPRRESQVRQMVWAGDGVWISIRLDSTIRLYHARTLQHLQDVDVEPYVSKVLGSGKLGFSFVRITSLMISSYRLWIGTGNGVVMSVPLSEEYDSLHDLEDLSICSSLFDSLESPGRDRHDEDAWKQLTLSPRCKGCHYPSNLLKLLIKRPKFSFFNMQNSRAPSPVSRDQTPKRRISKVSRGKKKSGRVFQQHTSLAFCGSKTAASTAVRKLKKVVKGYKSSNSTAPLLSSSAFNACAGGGERPGAAVRVYADPDPQKDRITPGTFIPYCSMANAQLSFHGYREAVKFFVAIPGCVTHSSDVHKPLQQSPSSHDQMLVKSNSLDMKTPPRDAVLVLSGGDGYVDFRRGDLGAGSPSGDGGKKDQQQQQRQRGVSALSVQTQPSHMIVWQLTQS